jgi:hypothetical protein
MQHEKGCNKYEKQGEERSEQVTALVPSQITQEK